ncbi:hypothetical protein Tco_1553662 [Tanacetum coccineum]
MVIAFTSPLGLATDTDQCIICNAPASEVPVVSTAEENISTAGRTVTYRRRSHQITSAEVEECLKESSSEDKKI